MKTALSIAGSDSGAGAGIQADLKTFSALGTYACTAITAITAQNTIEVSNIFEIPSHVISSQIHSVLSDMPPHAIKIGMVYSKEIIASVLEALSESKAPIVIDPIISSGTGARLLREDSVEFYLKEMIPRAFVITPNRSEAEFLSGLEINSEEGMLRAAEKIRSLGPKNVVVKGGHLQAKEAVDLLIDSSGQAVRLVNPKVEIEESHGSGCNFSAALTSMIANGKEVPIACAEANAFVHRALQSVSFVGRGLPVTNPLYGIYRDSTRFVVLTELQTAVDRLVELTNFATLIPETQTNFGYALPDASSSDDIAAVRGRIVRAGGKAIPVSRIEFGASQHVANAILSYMKFNPISRSAINIRYNEKIVNACSLLFSVATYNRSAEPIDVMTKEGATIPWGVNSALSTNKHADVIYHTGGNGKEAMVLVFGRNPADVVNKINRIIEKY